MGKSKSCKIIAIAVITLAFTFAAYSNANLIVNGNFETSNLDGWTVFKTTYGTNGYAVPPVVEFDVCGFGDCCKAAKFSVGTTKYPFIGGGGLSQIVTLESGNHDLSVCTAVIDTLSESSMVNQDGGLFELLFDGTVVASYDYGILEKDITYRRILAANLENVAAGNHEIIIRMTREYKSTTGAPYQYIGCVSLVPEPATIVMMGFGAMLILKRQFKTM